MRHCSVQVRGLLTRDELDRYNALMQVGGYLEEQNQYDLAYIVQKEVDILILPAIERLKEKGRIVTGPRPSFWNRSRHWKKKRTGTNSEFEHF